MLAGIFRVQTVLISFMNAISAYYYSLVVVVVVVVVIVVVVVVVVVVAAAAVKSQFNQNTMTACKSAGKDFTQASSSRHWLGM